MLSLALFICMNRNKIYLVAFFTFGPPVYSSKYRSNGTFESIGPPKENKTKRPVTHPAQLVSEDVNLIQEQNNRRPEEPSRIYYRIEKGKRFRHPVLEGGYTVRLQ